MLKSRKHSLGELSLRTEGEINQFPDKQRPKVFIITKPACQVMLKDLV